MAAVLAPTLVGMGLRASHSRVRAWITQHKTPLGLFCTFNLVAIVWQTLSSAHGALLRQSGSTLALVAVAAILQHFAYLAFNFFMAAAVVRLPPPEVVTVVIMGAFLSFVVCRLLDWGSGPWELIRPLARLIRPIHPQCRLDEDRHLGRVGNHKRER